MRCLILCFIILSTQLNAQEILVIDALTGSPIEGVSIMSKIKNSGVTSNKKGSLNISSFNDKDTLSIQHLAYQTIQTTKNSIKGKNILLYLKTNALENIEILESRVSSFENTAPQLNITSSKILSTQSTQTANLLEKTM